MILTRHGSKRRIAENIFKYFPSHDIYCEPFFGAGGMFFSKLKVNYNIMNDLDNDVFNLFIVIKEQAHELENALASMPIHETLFRHWKKLKLENSAVFQAVRFLFLSNFSYLGKQDTFLADPIRNTKKNILSRIYDVQKLISDVKFINSDFKEFFRKFSIGDNLYNRLFIYADPPYVGTSSTYKKFNINDTEDLFKILLATKCKFAVSEFDNSEIISLVKKYQLNLISIGERVNLKNRRLEFLVTNYRCYN